MRGRHLLIVATISVLLAISGCSTGEDDIPAHVVSSATIGDAESGGPGSVRKVVRKFSGGKYEIVVKSVKSDGTFLELALGVTVTQDGAASQKPKPISVFWADHSSQSAHLLRIIDFENAEVLSVGNSDGYYAVTKPRGGVGEEVAVTAYFAAPKSERVTLMMPMLGMIDGLEVSRAELGFDPAEDFNTLSSYTFDRSSMQSFDQPHESDGTVRIDRESVTISIPSDILFAFGSAELTATAAASIASVEESVRQYSAAGRLTVVGHTDDQGDSSINDPLSQGRAEAVGRVLDEVLSGEYSIENKGVGSREPAVEGTTTEARSANRRVEIQLEYSAATEAAESAIALPDAPEFVGVGKGAIRPTRSSGEPNVELRVTRVERAQGYLVASIEGTGLNPKSSSLALAFALPGGGESRGYDYNGFVTGAAATSMLTSRARVFPVDYRLSSTNEGNGEVGNWRTLVDRNLTYTIPADTAGTVTVVWPDPGTETITIEVAGLWRITDVPVEGVLSD